MFGARAWKPNPLLAEVSRGLAGAGAAQYAYLNYLAIQALVLFAWWPKRGLDEVLATGDGPDTLLAVSIALGIAVAYHGVRAGAEEILLPGQQPLREWAVGTSLPLTRVVGGYLSGHLLETAHALALSCPLLLAAFSVTGGRPSALAWCLTAVVFQATVYRLAGAVMYLWVGHYGVTMYLSIRALAVAGLLVTPFVHPAASYLVISHRLLSSEPGAPIDGSVPGDHLSFLMLNGLLCMALTAVLYRLLLRHRRVAAVSLR
jgi:hypothetical protein